jgi:carbon monoxide dehydrogenase subunit G
MRFVDMRQVQAPVSEVWAALHDSEVLRRVIPGCERLHSVGQGEYAATLAARVGRLADTYRGTFSIDDVRGGSDLVVTVTSRGRCGSFELDLDVRLREGSSAHTTLLAYDAHARVGGLVARLGRGPLTLAGAHITAAFFRELDRAVTRPAAAASALVPGQRRPAPPARLVQAAR